MRSRLRKFGSKLTLLFVGTLLAAAAGECFLRFTGYDPLPDLIGPRHLFQRDEDPALGIRLRPGFRGEHRTHEFRVPIAINSLGLRERELDLSAGGATRRILFLGDSMTYGFGVRAEETYARKLEDHLNPKWPVQTVNAAAPSYGTRHEERLAQRLLPVIEPDLVLVNFFFANDLSDNLTASMTERGGAVLSPYFGSVVDSSKLKTFALENSDLLTFAILNWMKWRDGLQLPLPPTTPPNDPVAIIESAEGLNWLNRNPPAESEAAWQLTAQHLQSIHESAQAVGAKLALVNLPLQYQIDPKLWERVRNRHQLNDGDYDSRAVHSQLAKIAQQLDVPCLDLGLVLAEHPEPGELYFPINKHFSPRGHEIVAAALAEFVEDSGLLED